MAVQIQLRRDTAANWTANNPVLAEGEVGIELVTDKFKIGDGVTPWNGLAYAGGGAASINISAGTTSSNVSAVTFSNSNGVSFGYDAIPETIQECCGLGQGFTLFRLSMFKDPRLRKPWFVTQKGNGGVSTQDLYFWTDARKYGYRAAVDTRVKVGHLDIQTGTVW